LQEVPNDTNRIRSPCNAGRWARGTMWLAGKRKQRGALEILMALKAE
jgi:hypothetical protein